MARWFVMDRRVASELKKNYSHDQSVASHVFAYNY